MAFRTNPAPYQRSKESTLRKMLYLTGALLILFVFAVIQAGKFDSLLVSKNLVKTTAEGYRSLVVSSILILVVALVTATVCDVLVTLVRHKKGGNLLAEIKHDIIHNYSYVSAIIFALTLPPYCSLYAVFVGTVFAVVVCKYFFGGFGRNIFNPAIMARILVSLCFGSAIAVPAYFAKSATAFVGVDAASGATLTTAFNNAVGWLGTTHVESGHTLLGVASGYSMLDILLGNYLGAMGETFTLLIVVLGIILAVLKVINWRTPVFYVGTVALTSLTIALALGFTNPLSYVVYSIALGGLMFGAVFMITDPVTGPTSPFGKCLIGAIAGFLTVLIRIKGGYPEGVMFSIAICNFISPAIDYFTVGKSCDHKARKYAGVFGVSGASILLCTLLALSLNGGRTVYEMHGMQASEYELLSSYVGLNEGDYLEKASDYTFANEDNFGAYTFYRNKESGERAKFSKAYYIYNENDQKIGITYCVNSPDSLIHIEQGEYSSDTTINAYAFVSFNFSDYSIYNIGLVTYNSDGKFMSGSLIEAATGLSGKNNTTYKLDGNSQVIDNENNKLVSGATYSSKIIMDFVEKAYSEYLTYKGVQ